MIQHAEVKPECFYDQDFIRRAFGLSNKAIGNACRAGKLRFSERGGCRFFRGEWVIAWLEGNAETITWVDVSKELPDHDIDVLIVCPSPTYPVWIAHLDGDRGWCDTDGAEIAYQVKFWAELPEGPK